jgi:hypothetical protein
VKNTGHEAPTKRRRWEIEAETVIGWRRWGNREGSDEDSAMLAGTFVRPFPGGSQEMVRAVNVAV